MNHYDPLSEQALLASLTPEASEAPVSGIVDMVNMAREKEGLIPLWVGEGSLPTPDFIADAATKSLKAGETFYTYQRGIPELRESLARYHGRLYDRSFDPEQFFVTGSGMQSIQIAVRMLARAGDEVIVPTPAWPNISAAVGIVGAKAVEVPMNFAPEGWSLDIDQIFAACTDKTRALFINSPCNPTGWTATREQLKAILDFARERNIWIIADEIYTRFYYGSDRETAPSFFELSEDDDKILFVNSFSKNWAMTGWRVGWICAPRALGDVIENLIQYSTSGVATFMQRAGIAALEDGEPFLTEQIARARSGRTALCDALGPIPDVTFAPPNGAFYLFFGLKSEENGLIAAKRLVNDANVGLAPGFAFGQSGSAFMRLCFATKPNDLATAILRLQQALT